MDKLLVPFVPVLIILSSLFILITSLYIWKWFNDGQKRRSPLNTDLIRQPAHGLRDKLDDITFDIALYMTLAISMPAYFLSSHLWSAWHKDYDTLWKNSIILLIAAMLVLAWSTWKLIQTIKTRIRYVHAINAELAVAQELEVLKADGCHVFHDLQTDKFNLDHVVVGPGGVYCIETKSRLKPDTDNRKQDAQVQFDGKRLKFPDWIETKPIEQAMWQTKWLKNYINKSTGESYAVTPVLALPGWFVKQLGRFDLRVVNPKNPVWMLNGSNCQSLDSAQIQRIAFQLEKLARIET